MALMWASLKTKSRAKMIFHSILKQNIPFFLIYLFIIIQHKIILIVDLHTERKMENRSALCDTNKGHGNKSYSVSFFKVGGKLQELSGLRGK